MLWKCCTKYASKFGKLSSGHRKMSVFIPVPKKGNAKECWNYRTIALISHASKVMLKILQARLQQYVNRETIIRAKAKVDVFLECSCFFDDPADIDNLISDSSAFSKSSLYSFCYSMHTLSCSVWDLVPWPKIKPRHPALGVWYLSHWTTREIPIIQF